MCLHCKSFENTWRKWEIAHDIFSFSHSVLYPFWELSAIFIKCEIVDCKLFQFGRVLNLSLGKRLIPFMNGINEERKKTLLKKTKMLNRFSVLPALFQSPSFSYSLTLSQTTNFGLYQTERVCRWQFQVWWKCLKVFEIGRKHRWKRRNCSL